MAAEVPSFKGRTTELCLDLVRLLRAPLHAVELMTAVTHDFANSVRATGRPKKARTEDEIKKESEDDSKMEVAATQLACELAEKVAAIESNPDIPVRAKKSKGEKCRCTQQERKNSIVPRFPR